MATQSLVVSRDPEILGVMGSLLNEAGMEVEVCPELPGAIEWLSQRKFDAVIVDCDQDKDGFELLMKLREDVRHQKMVAVGITSDVAANQAVFDSGATFVLNKPLPVEDARRILRISNGVITRAVRRFMRLPVDTLAVVSVDDRQEAIILNISQKGLALQTTDPLSTGQMVYVSFLLPNTFDLIESMAQVMWVDAAGGRAGIEFRTLTRNEQEDLSRWVWARAPRRHTDLALAAVQEPTTVEVEVAGATPAYDLTEIEQAVRVDVAEPQPLTHVYAVLLGIAVDLVVVASGVLLFFFLGSIVGHSLADPASAILGSFSGIVFWAIYRFLFSFFRVETVGNHAKRHVDK